MAKDLLDAAIVDAQLQGGRDYQQDALDWRKIDGPDGPFLLAAIADGTGAGNGSDAIAQAAVHAAVHIAAAYGPDHLDQAVNATREVVHAAHLNRGEYDGTTLTLASVDQTGTVRAAWVGDSRCYVLTRGGELVPLTRDHNLAAYRRPNVLTRSLLGVYAHDHDVDDCVEHTPETATYRGAVRSLLLCTDGVCGALGDAQIGGVMAREENVATASSVLVAEAVEAAGAKADNATAVIVDLSEVAVLVDDEPVHDWFGLTYSSYQVVPRVLAQSMPPEWQRRFVRCLREVEDAFSHLKLAEAYDVHAAVEVEANMLTEAQMDASGVTCDREGDDDDYEFVYHDAEGNELEYDSRVLVHVAEPLPPYNRGRTRVPTRFEVERPEGGV